MAASILLVEDSPEVVTFLRGLLAEYGYRVHACTKIEVAYGVLRRNRVDLALVDGGQLSDGSGLDFVRNLRRRGNRLPMVFLADRWLDDALYDELTQQLGIHRIVRKPISANELLVHVQMVLGSLPGEGLVEVDAEPLRTEELDAQSAASRILAQRQSLESALEEKVRELGQAIEGPFDPAAVRALVEQIRDGNMTVGRTAVARLAGPVLEALRSSPREIIVRTARALVASGLPGLDPDSRARLVLLDDDLTRAARFCRVAKDLQVSVDVAAGLDEAGGLLQGAPPDAVVVHLLLANNDPLHAARVLRTLAPALPILLVGPEPDVDARVSAIHAGVSFVLVDPVSPAALEAALVGVAAERATLQPQVLLVDALGTFAPELSPALSPFAETAVLSEPRRIFEVLSQIRPDVILVAADLGGWSGFDLCRLLRSAAGWQDIPVILLLEKAPVQARIAAFEAGADDWVGRPFLAEELLARIRARVERIRALSDRTALDALTGLRNRSGFLQAARERLADAARVGRPMCLCLVDIKDLGAINRERGHLAGERVLAGLGRTLGQRFRLGDVRGRWSGGEFALCLSGVEGETAQLVLARVANEFQSGSFPADDGSPFSASFRAGVATFPEDGPTFEHLLAEARRRLA